MMVVKRNLLFQGAIFGFHVKLWEGRFSHPARYVAPQFRRDREVVLAAVRSYGQALKFVDENLSLACLNSFTLACYTSTL